MAKLVEGWFELPRLVEGWFGLPRLVVSWFWMPRACYNCTILDIGGVISCVV